MLKIVEFPKLLIKMKNCKTFYETQTAIRFKEIIQPPHHPHNPTRYKSLLRLWNERFLTEKYRKI